MTNWGIAFIFLLSIRPLWASGDLCSKPQANISQQSIQAQKIENASIVTCAQRNQAKSIGLDEKRKAIEEQLSKTNIINSLNGYGSNKMTPEDLKDTLVAKALKYQENYDCNPVFKYQEIPILHPTLKPIYLKDNRGIPIDKDYIDYLVVDYKKLMKEEAYIKAGQDMIDKIKERDYGFTFCDPTTLKLATNGVGYKVIEELIPECSENFKHYFPDNQSDIEATQLSKLNQTSEFKNLVACIKSRLSNGVFVKDIKVSASSSALNNTNEAKEKYGEKNFLGLSKDRASTAAVKIVPLLFDEAGVAFDKPVSLDYKGSNGDGTSGKCPYFIPEGKVKEEKIGYYDTEAGKLELDKAKYVNIKVIFDKGSVAKDSRPFYKVEYQCRSIIMTCGN